ncbi:MAG TPA: hypothetical protein VH062_37465 [Polyangiaceae bacterium]|jgi:hypothetical protein|nr:hypothetical protein [Polyangiaceae bacterium]
MRLPGSLSTWLIALSALVLGCQPNIGDSCKLHTDCDATGNRLCEPNLPGGYCTIFNCEPDSCPGEAACVAFGIAPSTKPECAVTQQQRLERTYCMARCSRDSSCRSGYACVDLSKSGGDNVWNATIIDPDRGTQVCTVAVTSAAEVATMTATSSASDEVCSPPLDASFAPVPDAGFAGPMTPIDASTDAATDAARSDGSLAAPDAQGGS